LSSRAKRCHPERSVVTPSEALSSRSEALSSRAKRCHPEAKRCHPEAKRCHPEAKRCHPERSVVIPKRSVVIPSEARDCHPAPKLRGVEGYRTFLQSKRMAKKIVVWKHPLAIRWFHWINFPILLGMVWSGLLIYWANSEYNVRIGGKTLFHFFPKGFYKALDIPYRLAEGMSWHFLLMWVFFINGLLYVLYTIFSGQWRYLLPQRNSFREAWQVILHDLHIRKSEPAFIKYNGAQRIAYSAIVLMGIGSLITGLAIYKPVQFGWMTFLCGGYEAARLEHFILTLGYVLFFLVHILQVIKAGWNQFRAMITGFEIKPDPTSKQTP
jgi:thiosulfate reductase cytochrome b subunit